jgi:Phosphopantetheinyl transferase
MEINIHLTLINLSEELQATRSSYADTTAATNPRPGVSSSSCDDDISLMQNSSFENLVRETLTKCGIQEIGKRKMTTTHVPKGNGEEIHKEISSILRYLKIKDRYVAFCSVLLKSFLHHSFLMSGSGIGRKECDQEKISTKKIHILPRTKEGKPYILLIMDDKSESTSITATSLPFSISHQFPFVGAAYLEYTNDLRNLREMSNICPMVGLDIVNFGSYDDTKHLYSCEDEFLDVFQDYFTVKEWAQIQSADSMGFACSSPFSCRIQEFFLRWSIKEAYTKAIGTGMMTNFNSFETALYRHIANNKEEDGGEEVTLLSDQVLKKRDGSHFLATIQPIVAIHEHETTTEEKTLDWHIIFVPLYTAEDETRETPPSACACICASAYDSECLIRYHDKIKIASFELMDLVRFHNPYIKNES